MQSDSTTREDDITFSVIIPAYNVEPYLARCLDSVLPALGEDDEVILSLEGSADRSNEIAEQYEQRFANVRIVRHHEAKGPAAARNCAVQKAVGAYIVYIDGDDRVDTECFRHVLWDIREENSKAGITADDDKTEHQVRDLYIYDFYCDNQLTGRLEPFFQIGEGNAYDGIDQIHRILKARGSFWNIWRCIYSRDFLRRNDIVFSDYSMGEDIDYMTSVLLAYPRASFRHDPYYIYRRYRSGSLMSRQTLHRLEDVVNVLRRSIRRMKDAKLSYADCVASQFQYEYILNMALIPELAPEDRAKGKAIFADAHEVLKESSNRVVRLVRTSIDIAGVGAVSYAMHMIKHVSHSIRMY